MNENDFISGVAADKPLAIKVAGVGSAGLAILDAMARTDLKQLKMYAIHASSQALEACGCPEKLLLGAKRLRGIGTGGDPELGRVIAEEEEARLKSLCADCDLLLVATGLGGGAGGGISPVLARAARESGALVLALAVLPFDFEGMRRQKQALHALHNLKGSADAVLCLPNQKIVHLVDGHAPITAAFQRSAELLVEGARGIWQMLACPALIRIDFAYLYSVLRGRQSESAFASAEGSGENRAADILDQIFSSPLLDEGKVLKEADSVLVSIVGGPDMTLAEVNKLMDRLNGEVESAQLVMGASIDPFSAGRIRATVIASRHGRALEMDMGAERGENDRLGGTGPTGIEASLLPENPSERPPSRFLPPPPALPQEKARELLARQKRGRKGGPRFRQQQLPLEIVSKGRFEKAHPTIYQGEDLDVPTYIRRGIHLN